MTFFQSAGARERTTGAWIRLQRVSSEEPPQLVSELQGLPGLYEPPDGASLMTLCAQREGLEPRSCFSEPTHPVQFPPQEPRRAPSEGPEPSEPIRISAALMREGALGSLHCGSRSD